jgi:sodium/bile acid cotransporter 7
MGCCQIGLFPLQFYVHGKAYQVIKILNIMIVFLISGAMLKTDDIKKAWQHKLGVAFGFLSTLAITPCLGFALREISLTPSAFTAGLTLTTAVPQTLGIGISLVRSCGGNEGLALMMTAGTNIVSSSRCVHCG